MEFAQSHVTWPQGEWDQVIFSDEKKWNLVGNDAFVSAWVENQNIYTQVIEKQLCGGIMVWGAISSNHTIVLVHIDEKINAATYVNLIDCFFLHHEGIDLPEDFIFQQDNGPTSSCQADNGVPERRGNQDN